ncbi:MAG: NAD-dependent epimerase/dehydratase family protein [Sandaracinaceae bacterium]
MRVTCLGSTRLIGPATIGALRRAGHEVILVHRGAYEVRPADVDERRADRGEAGAFREAVRATRPDAIVDLRAMTRVQAEVAAGIVDVPYVVLSSQDVYAQFGTLNGLPGPAPEALITEASPLTVPYPFRGIAEHSGGPDYDKKDVEAVYECAGGAVTVLRLPAVYGRGDPRRRFGVVLDALDAGERELPRAGGRLRWTFGHVDDIATAIGRTVAAPSDGYRCFNVGESHAWSMSEWAERIGDTIGVSFSWREVDPLGDPLDEAWGLWGPVPNDVVVDSSRFRSEIGVGEETSEAERLTDLVSGLRESRPSKSG